MVLKKLRAALFFGVFLPAPAWAAADRYQVRVSNCPVRVRSPVTRAWVPWTGSLRPGAQVLGRPVPQRPSLVFFVIPEQRQLGVMAAPKACFVEEGALTSSASSHANFFASLGVISWQESLTLVDPTNAQLKLTATTFGACVGGGWEKHYANYDFGIEGCFAYGKSSAGNSSESSTSTYKYLVTNSDALALAVGPTLLWRPLSHNVALGVHAPLIFRRADWPAPDGLEAPAPSTTIFPTLWFEARFERLPWGVSQRVGFFRGLSNLVWTFQFNYFY